MASRHTFRRVVQGRCEKGASLIELVVMLPIFLIALLATYVIFDTAQTTYVGGATDIDLQDSGRNAMERMAQLIRTASYDPMGTGIFGFGSGAGFTPIATERTLLFSLDADEDGVLDNNSNERVGFALFGSELRRTVDGVTSVAGLPPVATNVQSIHFSYFNGADVPIPNPPGATYTLTAAERATIRRINIRLTLSAVAAGRGTRLYTLSTDARLRSL